MKKLGRATPATLDVLRVLTKTSKDLHGFAVAKQAQRPTGSVYVILSRLEEAGWTDSYWETASEQNQGRPRRRFYRLNPDGLEAARLLLAEKSQAHARPASSHLGWIAGWNA
jgi:DNA-binding PadR family transcriptional regulator